MDRIRGIKGMRHIALKVTDAARSKSYYQEMLGLDAVWEPDPQNVYLSSGCDNIALHEISDNFSQGAAQRCECRASQTSARARSSNPSSAADKF